MGSSHKKANKEELNCLNTLDTKLVTTGLYFHRKHIVQIIL